MAVLTELRNSIRSGDVSIVGSREHKDFEEYLFSKEDWSHITQATTKLAVSLSAEEYLEERTESLIKRLNWGSNNVHASIVNSLSNVPLYIGTMVVIS